VGQKVPVIGVSMELVTNDPMDGYAVTHFYDRDIPTFPFSYKEYDATSGLYMECEMLQDIGAFKAGQKYSYLGIVYELFGYDENDNLL
jgi:hypothetical protein